jgi:hypothetical protein
MSARVPVPRPPADITLETQIGLIPADGEPVPLPVRLCYCRLDPYAIRLQFMEDQLVAVEWVFDRNLLILGQLGQVGYGDVCVMPSRDATGRQVVMVSLTSPDGHALLEVDDESLQDFMDRTLSLVPEGTESRLIDTDATIRAILG